MAEIGAEQGNDRAAAFSNEAAIQEAQTMGPRAPMVMGTDIANAIVTRAPLTLAQLHCALDHYAELEAMLRRSGPRFTNCRRDAADMHNKTLELLREAEAKPAESAAVVRQPLQA